MRLAQFDKLQILLNKLEQKTRLLKQTNFKLTQENIKLREELELIRMSSDTIELLDLNKIKKENELLQTKNNYARTQLVKLIHRVEGNIVLEKGVG
jgi:hypothetical protein